MLGVEGKVWLLYLLFFCLVLLLDDGPLELLGSYISSPAQLFVDELLLLVFIVNYHLGGHLLPLLLREGAGLLFLGLVGE